MKIKAILFDMDGTLLPMDMDKFINLYFKELGKIMIPFGFTPDELKTKLFAGIKAMYKNDGHQSNMAAFWEVLAAGHENLNLEEVIAVTDAFYSNEFHRVKSCTDKNPLAVKAIALAHEKSEKVILSTNPLFPMAAQESRLSWVGLKPEQFDLITSYESDSYCKPNPQYFISICERMNLRPEECLMIGNDELEDMHCASSLGMQCYLVTDWMIPREGFSWNGPKGTFEELIEYLKNWRNE